MGKILIFVIGILIMVGNINCARKGSEVKSEKIVIRFAAASFNLFDEIRERQAELFEESHPEVDIVYEPVSGNFDQKMLVEIAGGSPPDVFMFFGGPWKLSEFARKGVLLDLTNFILKDQGYNLEDQYDSIVETIKVEGKVFGVLSNAGLYIMYYNLAHFDEMGIQYPQDHWSWNEIIEAGKKLTKRDATGRVDRYGIMLASNNTNNLFTLIKQLGGRFLSDDKTRCLANSHENLTALKLLDSFGKEHRISPTLSDVGRETGGSGTFLTDYNMFKMGRCSMVIGGRWFVINFRPIKELNYRFALLPRSKLRATSYGSAFWVAYSRTKYPDVVWEFLKFLGSREGQIFLVKCGDSEPTYKDLLSSEAFIKGCAYPNEDNTVFFKSMPYTFTWTEFASPLFNWDEAREKVLTPELDALALNKQTPELTLQRIEDGINKMMNLK